MPQIPSPLQEHDLFALFRVLYSVGLAFSGPRYRRDMGRVGSQERDGETSMDTTSMNLRTVMPGRPVYLRIGIKDAATRDEYYPYPLGGSNKKKETRTASLAQYLGQ